MKIRDALEKSQSESNMADQNDAAANNRVQSTDSDDRYAFQTEDSDEVNSKYDTNLNSINTDYSYPQYSQSRRISLKKDKLKENHIVGMFAGSPEVERYKVLRTQILSRTRKEKTNTLIITSVSPGEGKTLTAINLSLVMAREFNQTVLLVDCDLKKQNVHKYLGYNHEYGVTDYLRGHAALKDLIIWPGIDRFTVISGGEAVLDSSEYLGSNKMKSMVTELKTRYEDRFIIFDTMPILTGADFISMAPAADKILMVVESAKTSLEDVKKALELVPKDKFIGFVMNRHESKDAKYAY